MTEFKPEAAHAASEYEDDFDSARGVVHGLVVSVLLLLAIVAVGVLIVHL